MDDKFYSKYNKYISSSRWKKMRSKFINNNNTTEPGGLFDNPISCYRCDNCGLNWPKEMMEVHHTHYRKPFGEETRDDVLVVCKKCHPKVDEIRAQQGRARGQAALDEAIYYSGFETWITKRYGEDAIDDYRDSEIEHERFQDFLERNEESDSW